MEAGQINLWTLAPYFTNEELAWKLLESWRWPNGPVCPKCGVVNHAYYLTPKTGNRKTSTGSASYRRTWKCAETNCRNKFSVLVGTIFEDSKIPVSKWLMAYHLMSSAKNGISAKELERMLEISYKSAWFMAHRIRYSVEHQGDLTLMTGTVESDETYIGGRRKGKFRGDQSWRENKTPVVTLVERNGEARSLAVERVTGDTLALNLVQNVDADAHLMTDENRLYALGGSLFASHHTVNHSQEEYARGANHVNTAEGFFSQLKRGIDGTYHHVSKQHLHRYLGEFDYRYNTRKISDGERTVKAIQQTAGKRLMYDKVVSKTAQV
jgi:transposase-like protein